MFKIHSRSSSGNSVSQIHSPFLLKAPPWNVFDGRSDAVVHVFLFHFEHSLPLTVRVRHGKSDLHDETQELLLDQAHQFPQLAKLMVDLKRVFRISV